MHIPSTIRTSYGPRSVQTAPMVRVTLTPREVHDLAQLIERDALEAEREGRHDVSTTLSWRAAALREAVRQ